jgi:hypothetical protein
MDAQEAAVLSQVEEVRLMVGLVPRSGQLADAVWRWLARHWSTVGAVISATVAVALLATSTLPSMLAPFVLGPLATIVVSAWITPADEARDPRLRADTRARRRV